MRTSAFAKKDTRDTHTKWCDAMVKKAQTPKRSYSVQVQAKVGVKRNNYTTSELINLLRG